MAQNKSNLGGIQEELIKRSCEVYAARGIANIDKTPTPYKVIGRGTRPGSLTVVPEAKAGVDFKGEIGGRSFAMEAKKTENLTSYRMDAWNDKKRGTEENQRRFLDRWKGYRFYLISFMGQGRPTEHFLVPFEAYMQHHNRMEEGNGPKSITRKWFREYCPAIEEGGRVPLDFIAAIEEGKQKSLLFKKFVEEQERWPKPTKEQ